jgi:cytochrome c-type biogenesis protein CcmF
LNEDLYVNFAGTTPDGLKVIIQAFVFPLVSWIWVGYWVVLMGTLVCLVPNKNRLIWARTEVVGIAGKHAKVEN